MRRFQTQCAARTGPLLKSPNTKETRMELEIAKLNYSLLQKEIELLRMSLKWSGRFTWIWFLLSLLLLAILLSILYYLYWFS